LRGKAQGDDGRERQQAAAAGDGVHRAGGEADEAEEDEMEIVRFRV
jgi:hypothetical protein